MPIEYIATETLSIKVPNHHCDIHGEIEDHVIAFHFTPLDYKTDKYCLLCLADFIIDNFKPVKEIK
jgi:hypothetical protein